MSRIGNQTAMLYAISSIKKEYVKTITHRMAEHVYHG